MAKVRLGDIATVVTKGTTPTTMGFQFEDGGINFVKIESISEDGTFLKEKFSHISDECNVQMRRSQLQENDILFSIAGAIGRSAIVTKEILPANTNQALAIIRVPKGKIDYNYLLYALSSSAINQQATQHQQGVAQLNISLKNVSDFLLPIYTEAMQKRIVYNLKKIDKLISLRKQQLAKLDELVKARFVEKSKEWQAVPGQLNEFLEDITYGFTNPMPDAEEGPWKVTAKDVVNGHINILTARKTTNEAFERLTNKSKPRKGDVLLTKDGTLGRVAVVDVENLCVNQSVAVMRCNNKIYPEFLAMILQMPEYQRKLLEDSGGGTIKHLYITKVDKMLISVPDLVIQKDLLMFAKRVEQQKHTVQQSLEKLELMKKALMQEYFG